MRSNLRNVRRTIREEQKGLRDCIHILFDSAADDISKPPGRGLARQEDSMTPRPQFLHNEVAHRCLPRAVNAFECYEAGEHPRGQGSRRTLNPCRDAPYFPGRTTFL